MKYDFVFLYHPHFYEVDPGAQLGLGLLSLATYAKHLGASVKVINCQSQPTMGAVYRAMYSCKYLMMYGCLIDAPILNAIATNAKLHKLCDYVYVGGPIAKSKDKIDLAYIDAVIDDPGEDFVESLINNTCFLKGPLNKNINEYPFPDRTLLEGGYYGGNIFKREAAACAMSTTILTSRGCTHNCAFCLSGNENFFQSYNIDRIEKEIEHCLSLGIQNFRISDDNFLSNSRHNKLCKIFKEAKIKWRASIRATYKEIGFYENMVESGCEELSFGIESGDQKVLDVLEKNTTIDINMQAVARARKAGIPIIRALLMMGTPGETKNTLIENYTWVVRAHPHMISLKMFVPYPGTKIYENPKKYGYTLKIVDTNNSAYRPDGSEPQANIDNKDMTSEQLTQQFHKMKTWLEYNEYENRG